MLRATEVMRRAAVKPERVADRVLLDHEGRHRRRAVLRGEGGLEFLLDLASATAFRDGDAARLEDGRLVVIRAAAEPLMEVRAETPLRLMRVAWHVGNRHTPAELAGDAIYLAVDHVLEEMLRGLGASVRHVERPFEPERGAYHAHGGVHDGASGLAGD